MRMRACMCMTVCLPVTSVSLYRSICDVLLANENLDVYHPLHWNATFKTIRKIIGGVDYKVCVQL